MAFMVRAPSTVHLEVVFGVADRTSAECELVGAAAPNKYLSYPMREMEYSLAGKKNHLGAHDMVCKMVARLLK